MSSLFILAVTGLKIVEMLGAHRSGYMAQEQSLSHRLSSGSFIKAATLQTCSLAAENYALEGALERLDTIKPGDDYDGWVKTVQHAERAALSALACAPTNGHYWALFAMIRQSQVEIADELKVLMRLSQQFAPVELGAINARLSLSTHVSTQTLSAILPSLDLDRRLICDPRYRWSQAILVRPNAALAAGLDGHQMMGWCRR